MKKVAMIKRNQDGTYDVAIYYYDDEGEEMGRDAIIVVDEVVVSMDLKLE